VTARADVERRLFCNKISRRQFLERAAALGIVAASPDIVARSAVARTPQQGGRARIAIGSGSSADSLDPATFENEFTIDLCYGHHNHLVEVIDGSRLEPELAESWETDDGQRWKVHLRRGVEFHNGKEVTADDVIASFRHHMGPDAISAARSLLQPLKSIRKENSHTLIFELDAPMVDFMYITSDYHIAIKPAMADGRINPTDGIGAGPFRIHSFRPGEAAFLTRYENYWKEGRPYFEEIEMLVIHDQSARTIAMMTGELDIIDSVDLGTAHLLDQRPGVRVVPIRGLQHYSFAMRTDMTPFDQNHVRLALKHAVDRRQLVDTVLRGYGEIGNDHPIAPGNRYFNADLPQREYDADRARWHLRQAGLEKLSVALYAADAAFGGAVDAAVLFRETASRAGIDLQVVRAPNDGYWSEVWMSEPFCAVYWGGRITEDWMFSTAYLSDANWNDTFWSNDRFDKLIRAARGEFNEDLRAEMYAEAQRLVRDEGGAMIPMFADFVHALSDRIGVAGDPSGPWALDNHKWFERWWID